MTVAPGRYILEENGVWDFGIEENTPGFPHIALYGFQKAELAPGESHTFKIDTTKISDAKYEQGENGVNLVERNGKYKLHLLIYEKDSTMLYPEIIIEVSDW